jgi:3-oxoacyl-[acyl-carrier protein] reductase
MKQASATEPLILALSDRDLTGRRALVTAGGQGIGQAIVRRLLAAGCRVAVHSYQTPVEPERLAAEVGCAATAIGVFGGDLRTRGGAEAVVGAALEWLGGLDILVNNAGSLIGRRRLGQVDEAFWAESVALNLGSVQWVTQAAAGALEEAGRSGGATVINLASLAGRKGGHAGSLVYSTMKGAVLTWTRSLASEWGPLGIRVNAVAPGLILGSKFHAEHTTAESAAATIAGIPLGRAGSPDDVARAVVWLAAEFDGFITGATIDINGGVYGC